MNSAIGIINFRIENLLRRAARGDMDACYDLGMIYSSGSDGAGLDLIEAHKWFNIAGVNGYAAAQAQRSEIAYDMTAREIAVAQKAARAWLRESVALAA
jgi:TPR repeat protein